MTPEQQAIHTLKRGLKYPFDATDAWWADEDQPEPPAPVDWAHAAARGILADLGDRGGIKHGFNDIDEEIRADIVNDLAAIIRLAYSEMAL